MPDVISIPHRLGRRALVHSARTAVAAVLSLVVARALGLAGSLLGHGHDLNYHAVDAGSGAGPCPNSVSLEPRLGAVMGAFLTAYFGSNVIVFGLGVFALGLVCCTLHLEDAYRLASVTLAIVMLIARTKQVVDRRGSTASSKSPWESQWGWH